MRSFVINLDRSEDRMEAFRNGWKAPFPCERFAAADGSRTAIPHRWKHDCGNYGLVITYLSLFSQIVRTGQQEPFLVFEDDALFREDWHSEIPAMLAEVPSDWWMINLGPHTGVSPYQNPTPVSPTLARLHHAWRTHAAVYNPPTLGEMISALGYRYWPVDQVWCDMMINGNQNFYTSRKYLVGTRAGVSVSTGQMWDEFPAAGLLGTWINSSVEEASV